MCAVRPVLLATILCALGCAEGREPILAELPERLVPLERCLVDARAGAEPPALLSETGCFERLDPLTPIDEIVPFTVASPLFTDGARKDRWLGLPAGARVEVGEGGAFGFPLGAVLVKHFAVRLHPGEDPVPVETRFMIRAADGWRFATYRWSDDRRDARRLDDQEHARLVVDDPDAPDGSQVIDYLFPSETACRACHAGGAIGPSIRQLDLDVRYGGGAVRSQLEALHQLGAIDSPPSPLPDRMPSPADPTATLEARARSYLHANCAHCHRPGGGASSALDLDLRWDTPLSDTRSVCVPTDFPSVAGWGMRIEPGDPDASVIVRRMEAGPMDLPSMMPPLGRSIVDRDGVAVVRSWIEGMEERCD